MSEQKTLWDTEAATSLPASADGGSPLILPGGRKIGPSGQGHARANRSRKRASVSRMLTPATSGLFGLDLSPSAVLQRSLESRLAARMGVSGSPEYGVTWKRWAMRSGVPICAL